MHEANEFESLLRKAKEFEKNYEWIFAADFQEKALDLAKIESSRGTEVCGHIGYCYLRAAFQSSTKKDYSHRIKLAIKAFERAVELHQSVIDGKKGLIDHAKAMVVYANSWLAVDPTKKRELVNKWWKLEIEVLNYWEKAGDRLAFGITCANLSEGCLGVTFMVEQDWGQFKRRVEEGVSYGEKAIVTLSEVGDSYDLARAYCWTIFYLGTAIWYRVMEDRREEFGQKFLSYSKKALELSKKIGDAWLIGHTNLHVAVGTWAYTADLYSVIMHLKEAKKLGVIAKDNMIIGMANTWLSFNTNDLMIQEEDPEKQREGLKKSLEYGQGAIKRLHNISWYSISPIAYAAYIDGITWLATIEADLKTKNSLFQEGAKIGREGLKYCKSWVHFCPSYLLLNSLSTAIYRLSQTKSDTREKRRLLEEALEFREEYIGVLKRVTPLDYWVRISGENYRALILAELAEIEKNEAQKIKLLNKAVLSMEKCLELIVKDISGKPLGWKSPYVGLYYYFSGKILEKLFTLTKKKNTLEKAIGVFSDALEIYSKTKLNARVAECHWQIAKLYDQLENFEKAAVDYNLAAKTYKLAAIKNPKLKDFYHNYSLYMLAWGQIEKARHAHEIEDYDKAGEHYEKAGKLHESSESWRYLAPNYKAWASIENAESLSRNEQTESAKKAFQKSLEQFNRAEKAIREKLEEISSEEETEMTQRLLKSTDLRRKFCQARILLEESKLLDKKGKHLQSARNYGKAAQNIESIIEKVETESEKKEMELIAILCRAWEKMALAEGKTSPKTFLEAAELFEKAKNLSPTKKTSLWALGNSSFCKGLAAKNKFQSTLKKSYHSMANKHMKNAASFYNKAGFETASDYAKATQRLFDAYVYMNSAEDEVDPDKKTKYYQIAEQLLQIAAGLFMKAKQPEKTSEVQRILSTVREEKALAVSLNQVMQAPTIASTTLSFIVPTPTTEIPVGLERFEHANVQANLVTHARKVKVGESFCLLVEFVNAGKEPALLIRVEEFIPSDFIVVKKPEIYRLEDTCLNMKGKQIGPLKLVEAKLVLQPSRKGVYRLNPKVHYLDELGQNRSLQLKSIEIKVEEVTLANRMSTGTQELDSLLLGGIPEEYAIALTGPPSDERQMIIKNFLKAGTKKEQITFYISTEVGGLEVQLQNPNFYLFLCNPKPKTKVPDLPNIYKLRSKTDLTNLSISLTKANRNIDQSSKKRVCVEIVSDVLIKLKAEATRRWIAELITDLGSKGFTMLAVMDPGMHPVDQSNAVVNLFDGEISIMQSADPLDCKKSIYIKKLRNQDYIKNPICLT